MTSQEAGMQAGLSRDVGLDHNIVVEEVDQERSYWKNIRTLGKAGKWNSVLKILAEDTNRDSRSSIAQLLQPMNTDKDTIVHRAADEGKMEVVRKLLLLIKKEDNQELWRERQANIHGNNPLHMAAMKRGHDDTCKCIAEMLPELAKATNKYGNTPLYLAAGKCHEGVCKYLADIAPETVNATNKDRHTPLHRAAAIGHVDTCKWLVEVAPETAKVANKDGNTPLHLAVARNNRYICRLLAERAPETGKARNANGDTPIFLAAISGDQLLFGILTAIFIDDHEIAFARRRNGDTILHCAISGKYFDLASTIIDKYKELIYYSNEEGLTPLHLLANNPSLFKSGCRLGLLEHFFYKRIKVSIEPKSDDLKHQKHEEHTFKLPSQSQCLRRAYNRVKETLFVQVIVAIGFILSACLFLIPASLLIFIPAIIGFSWWRWILEISKVREKKQKHEWAKKVMKQLVENIDNWWEFGDWTRGINPAMRRVEEIPSFASQQEIEIASKPYTNFTQKDPQTHTSPNQLKEDRKREMKRTGIIQSPFLIAGKKGVIEMVKEILNKFPIAIHDMDLEDKYIIQLAAEYRQQKIYAFMMWEYTSFLFENVEYTSSFFENVDAKGNSTLHLAAKYPQGQAVLIPGAASQMYYEYRWFQFVKATMPPYFTNRLNHDGETAMEVFIKTHKELATERAKWLRNASESCSVVAALIITVAFATISNVPGGLLQDKGIPVFQGGVNFNTFSISSFIAFCFSALSLIMFLGILFFPNQDLDFGNNKPSNLIWGINSLFVSIVAMFLSFFTGDLFVLDKKMKYIAYPTFVLTFFMAISRSPFYSEFTGQATFYSEEFRFHIPKRAYQDNLSF